MMKPRIKLREENTIMPRGRFNRDGCVYLDSRPPAQNCEDVTRRIFTVGRARRFRGANMALGPPGETVGPPP